MPHTQPQNRNQERHAAYRTKDQQDTEEQLYGLIAGNSRINNPTVSSPASFSAASAVASDFWELDEETTPESMRALYPANMNEKSLFFEDQERSIRTFHHAHGTGLEFKVPDDEYVYFSNVSDGFRISIKDDELQFWRRTGENSFAPGLRIDSLNIEDINALYFGDDNLASREKIDREIGGGGGNRLDYYAGQQHKFWTGGSDSTEKLLFSIGSDNNSNGVRLHSDARLDVDGNAYFNEDVVFGAQPTEHVAAFISKIGSDLIPSFNIGYDLGSSDNKWGIIWAGGANLEQVNVIGSMTQSNSNVSLAKGNGWTVTSHGDVLAGEVNLNLGSFEKPWGDIHGDTAHIGTLNVSNFSVFHKDVSINADLLIDKDLEVDGDIILGTGNSDSLRINADLESNITVNNDDTYYLGNSSKGFKNIYAQEITIKEKIKTDDIEIDGTLNHDGSFVGFFGKSPVIRQQATEHRVNNPYEPTAENIVKLNASIGNLFNALTNLGLIDHDIN